MKKMLLILCFAFLLPFSQTLADEGDFFFAPEVGWSHVFTDNLKEGVFAGAHFGYDTSDSLTIELIAFYGDNNGEGINPDLRYILGGGGLSYSLKYWKLKPSLFAGATVAGFDYSNIPSTFKGGLYLGTGFEVYLNKVVSLGITFKYIPLIKSPDISLLAFRFGFEL